MAATTAARATAPLTDGPRLAAREFLWLNLVWFANSLHWGALLAQVLAQLLTFGKIFLVLGGFLPF